MRQLISNRYQINNYIGKGGMASVYLAYDLILERTVAIKIMEVNPDREPATLIRFFREANAITKLKHTNIVDIYDVGEDEHLFYIVMEYVKGPTLKEYLARRGPFSVEEAISIMKQVAAAVQYAHNQGIIHRDIKPQNVMIKPDGTIKLTDFGIAVREDTVSLTKQEMVMGSAHYLAPESTRQEKPTKKLDIYSMGIVFFELLSGTPPFTDKEASNIAFHHVTRPLPSIRKINPSVPVSVENIIRKSCAKDPSERYGDVSEMIQDLNVALNPEHRNDAPISLNVESLPITSLNEKEKKEPKPRPPKKARWKKPLFTTLSILVLAFSVIWVLGFTSLELFSFIGYRRYPQLEGLSYEQAVTLLQSQGFTSDPILEYELSDTIDQGNVIETNHVSNFFVSQAAPVELVISSGPSFLIRNYVGESFDQVKEEFEREEVDMEYQLSYEGTAEVKPGIILEQSGLLPGEHIDPHRLNRIGFTLATYPSVQIPEFLIGMDVMEAKEWLNEQGIAVSLKNYYGSDTVIATEPQPGTLYTQEGTDSVVTLYY